MHPWQPHTAARVTGGYERQLVCGRCGSIKIQLLDTRGYVLKTKIHYTKGYVMPPGTGRLDAHQRAALRLKNTRAT